MAHLQPNGTFSTSTFLRLERDGLGGSLRDLTVCIWVNMYFLRGTSTYFFSYASESDDNEFAGSESESRVDNFSGRQCAKFQGKKIMPVYYVQSNLNIMKQKRVSWKKR